MKNGSDRKADDGSAIEMGRLLLQDWEAAQPDNFFTADTNLQRTLEFHWGQEKYQQLARQLYDFGRVATAADAAVRMDNLDHNLPRLERFDGQGQRIEEVIFHPSHHEAGRHIYGSGMLSVCGQPGNNLLSLALFYLSSQNGEAGHNCPVACTAGLIKVLQQIGTPELQGRYLPRLLDADYDSHFTGAQFLTEVQGGSDVGANATTATRLDTQAGTWLLNGEKWFCSNVAADLALVTARVPGQGDGTRGLGLFLVPRRLEDGQLNNVFIRRLKDKLGTRSMATGELEFRDALAYQMGPTEDGFRHVMTYVINTSRIYNAVGVSGNARRAYLTAMTYAQHRRAFGQEIIRFPLVQDQLANMRADSTAMLAGTLHIIKLLDDIELGQSTPQAEGFLRMAINLNKYRSAVLAHEVIVRAIELLGGNGAIESFSVLPRLLRDNVVFENWEGTHNVLLAQVQRDVRRYRVHEPFLAAVRGLLAAVRLEELRQQGLAALEQIQAEIGEVLAMDELTAAIYFRPLMDRLTDLYYAACMAVEGEWELLYKENRTKQRLATLFFNRRVAGRQPKDIAYYDDQVARLCQ
ncbi:MAG: acyl-CoA dehydrogenase family protein [Chloroflexi bacterium]|nr:acyl-CoA dehydrogenase family protein [Chloroflexota bacterium]MCI0576476.1 acyl-CoA dehydrogenase family protein [Chloroflexota bacterium]MCI0649548.1 acyl-CoA dehydrogenase family protein [Chloroflexota bacterium]MCI0729376.1 acyl-CoA dehydrogenase family protein [Chloroflexota bacterium]